MRVRGYPGARSRGRWAPVPATPSPAEWGRGRGGAKTERGPAGRPGSGGVQAGTFTLTLRSRSQPASPSPPGVQSVSSLPFLPPCLASFPASLFPPGPSSPAASPQSPRSARPREPISVGGGRRAAPCSQDPGPGSLPGGGGRARGLLSVAFLFFCSRLSLNSGQFPGLSFLSRSNSFPLHLSGIPFLSRYPLTSPSFLPFFFSHPPLTDPSTFHSLSLRFRNSLCLYSPPPVSPKACDLAPLRPGRSLRTLPLSLGSGSAGARERPVHHLSSAESPWARCGRGLGVPEHHLGA